ncbi:MAG: hypothetical protein IJC53_03490 [Clostridia bacterium]|nr:hypothetical protein [Clostridia bacterium]
MKGRLFYLIAAVIILAALLFSAAALLRGCAERPVTPSQPVDATGHDAALSEGLCLELLSAALADSGVSVISLSFSAPAAVRLTGEIETARFSGVLGSLSGLADALLPETMKFALSADFSLSAGRLVLLPSDLELGGLRLSADRLPDGLLSALVKALNDSLPELSGMEKLTAGDGYLYIWVE